MNHLVLGSSGQIGSHLVEYLRSQGEEVQTHDIEEDRFCDLRISDERNFNRKLKNADFVHFLAFDVGGARYLSKYQHTYEFLANNVSIMENTFAALKESKKPFIFSSSQMSNMNYSSYGVLKRLGEFYTRSIGGLVVKYWNVYGVESDESKSHVITDFIRKAMTTRHIDMMTDGEEERQFLYAEDCCRCHKILADNFHRLDLSQEYHLTSFEWSKIIDVAKIIQDELKDKVGEVTITKAESKDSVQNNKRNEPVEWIKQYWSPQVSLREGIREIICRMEKA